MYEYSHAYFESMIKGYEMIKTNQSEFKQPIRTSTKYNNCYNLWPHLTREPEQWP